MTMNRTEMSKAEQEFNYWADLARDDPEAFERTRREAIDALIADAPPERRELLRRTQWRVDRERERAGNPMGACIRLYRMMWETLTREYGLLQALNTPLKVRDETAARRRTAKVIPLRARRRPPPP